MVTHNSASGDDPNQVLERTKYLHYSTCVVISTCVFHLAETFFHHLRYKTAEQDRCAQIIIHTHLNNMGFSKLLMKMELNHDQAYISTFRF